MRIVVSVTISCSHRKYHGALAGFGVTSALAGSSSGDAMNTGRMLDDRDGAERDDGGAARQVGHGVDGGVRRLERLRVDRRRRAAGDAEQRVGLGRPTAVVARRVASSAVVVGPREAAVLAHAPHVVGEEHAERRGSTITCST